ncbi:hypothetical protein [Pseudomonas huanghezhanensis]|uniref:hypothetical protein n=1 Tax=Pseudomonas huanghezhanensis TaxID=3002903 RepID=UPI0022856365|nr:hypothetical protein [Pseudomonas sp. BSw22131]
MEISKSSVMNVAGKEIIVREVTVNIARLILQPNPDADFVGDSLFKDVRLCDLVHLTNLTRDEIEEMFPSDLAKVIDAIKERNPVFFEMLARVCP